VRHDGDRVALALHLDPEAAGGAVDERHGR
jgi:hypothetical protein